MKLHELSPQVFTLLQAVTPQLCSISPHVSVAPAPQKKQVAISFASQVTSLYPSFERRVAPRSAVTSAETAKVVLLNNTARNLSSIAFLPCGDRAPQISFNITILSLKKRIVNTKRAEFSARFVFITTSRTAKQMHQSRRLGYSALPIVG